MFAELAGRRDVAVEAEVQHDRRETRAQRARLVRPAGGRGRAEGVDGAVQTDRRDDVCGELDAVLVAALPGHALDAAAGDADLADLDAEPHLAAGRLDRGYQRLGDPCGAADRIPGALVVGAGDQRVLEHRCDRRPAAVVAAARTQHCAQQRIAHARQRLRDAATGVPADPGPPEPPHAVADPSGQTAGHEQRHRRAACRRHLVEPRVDRGPLRGKAGMQRRAVRRLGVLDAELEARHADQVVGVRARRELDRSGAERRQQLRELAAGAGAAQVVDAGRERPVAAAEGLREAARDDVLLENEHAAPAAGQCGSGGQAADPRSDDDGVPHGGLRCAADRGPAIVEWSGRRGAGPLTAIKRRAAGQPAARGLTFEAARFALRRAVCTSSARASATPIRRFSNDSGLPNSRRSVPGTASASATPSNTMPFAATPP
jgi:hypothetical protein